VATEVAKNKQKQVAKKKRKKVAKRKNKQVAESTATATARTLQPSLLSP